MSEGKSTNLLKAAKELNIGLSTAVEFLGKKGHQVEARPNTKLTDEMYDVLLKEFQGDKIVKEEAKQIVIGKIRRDEAPVTPERTEPQRSKEFEQEEILIKNVNSFNPPAPEKPKTETSEPEKPAVEEGSLPGVKVVGKINLDDLNSKTRPEKKAPEVEKAPEVVPETPKVETPKAPEPVKVEEPKPVVAEKAPEPKEDKKVEVPAAEVKPAEPVAEVKNTVPEVKAPKPVQEKPKAPEVKAEAKPKDEEAATNGKPELFRTKTDRLTGPNVIGKIELPTQPARRGQPVASSSNVAGGDHKRKRKRKDHPTGSNPGTPGQSRPAPGAPNAAPGTRQPYRGNAGGPNSRPAAGGGRADFRNKSRTPDGPKAEPTDKEIQDQIKATLARLSGAGKSGKFAQRAKLRRQKRDDVAQTAEDAAMELELQSKTIKVTEFVTANELASMLDVPVTQIISTCMS
ncbi:MAG: translation initiation factor IF-2, partial [Daejeonella sp.]